MTDYAGWIIDLLPIGAATCLWMATEWRGWRQRCQVEHLGIWIRPQPYAAPTLRQDDTPVASVSDFMGEEDSSW